MFMDFLGECMDEVTNQMAKMRYMFGGSRDAADNRCTTMCGASMNSMAAQHSQMPRGRGYATSPVSRS